jgi:hypothetical protein
MKKDAGDGRTTPYAKPVARTPHAGEVVAVAGSSAQISGGTLDYPAMAYSLNALGSLVLDVSADTLRARFLDDSGLVRDDFAIVKPAPLVAVPRSTPRFGIALAGANPARGRAQFVLEGVSAGATLQIVDAAGRRVRTLPVTGSRATWDAASAAPGVYFAVLEHAGARRVARVVLVP